MALAARPAAAAWPPYGAQLGSTYFWYYSARVYPNPDGGASLGYFARIGGTQTYPYLDGAQVAGDGSTLHALGSSSTPYSNMISSDLSPGGGGGIYIVHGQPDPYSVIVERVMGPPGWPALGLTLGPGGSGWAYDVACARTSDDGCLAAWIPYSTSGYVVPLLASIARPDATVDPGWGSGLPLGTAFVSGPGKISVAGDDSGGGYVAWWNLSLSQTQMEVRLTRVAANGSIWPGWPADGRLVANPGRNSVYVFVPPRILLLPGGDVMVHWKTQAGGSMLSGGLSHLQRVKPDGTVAPGWPPGGLTPYPIQSAFRDVAMLPDGGGGVLLVGSDGVNFILDPVLGNGAPLPGSPAPELRINAVGQTFTLVSLPESGYGQANSYNFRSCPDGQGGLFLAWSDARGNPGPSVWVAHWTNTGIPGNGWTVDGRMVNDPAIPAALGGIAAAPDGGVFVAWSRYSRSFLDGSEAYLAKVEPEFPTPVLISLVDATVYGDRVRLEWSLGTGAPEAAVYRSTAGGTWMRVATIAPDGRGRVAYEDAATEPGMRYGYRLGVMQAGAEVFAGETWVEVARAVLALEGARPNPSPERALNAAFTLADGSPARLDALDLAGRRVGGAEVGSLGAGRHVVTLARPGALPPGLYWLRLTQAGRQLRRHAVVLP